MDLIEMPYLKKQDRERLDPHIKNLVSAMKQSQPGEFNYVICTIANELLGKDYKYNDINKVVGALECAKLEWYLRKAHPYERKKILENGDIDGFEYG